MVSYYQTHHGNLYPGDIAKAEDIMQIQQNVDDMVHNVLEDFHERQGCILGGEENAFILVPDPKRGNRYIDQMNLAEGVDAHYISIRETDYRQPIKLSRSSLYSVIVKMQNKSEVEINVAFELHDMEGNLYQNKKAILTIPPKTDPTEYEVIFDLEYYPTAHGLDYADLEINRPELVIPSDTSVDDTEGVDHGEEASLSNSSLGASQIYLVVRALNKNKFDVNQSDSDGTLWNDEDPTFGILMNKNSSYGQLLEQDNGSGFVASDIPGDLYFKEIYANSTTYKCIYGEALIGGEKVCLADTHVSIDGASSYGNVISQVYMDIEGHLCVQNSEPFLGQEPALKDIDEPHLYIAKITTYADGNKDPIIDQDDTTQEIRPRSHHERLRRLEKQSRYTQDIAIPPRFKYTLTGTSWVDEHPENNIYADKFNLEVANTLDALKQGGYTITTDANGNFILKVSQADSFSIPITLKSTNSGITTTKKKTKILKSAQTSAYINALDSSDITRAQVFSEIKNMKIDVTNGIMTLDANTSDGFTVATTKKESKETEFNPWDDSARNRPKSADIKPTVRTYTVTSGKNGKNDWASEFPAMTFYTKTKYKLKKLEIPVHKFKNCKGVQFIIYKRQNTNNKSNTVWLQKRIKVSEVFSLSKAKVKNGYQYVDDGFLWNFGKNGLTLDEGQYVIIVLPIAKSGKGSVYIETYKPANSKDFCIRYYGAANASHFLLKDRYQEIWYNSAKATGEEITYDTQGSITSGTVTWTNVEPIKSIRPVGNITKPKGTNYKLEVDVGNGWTEIKLNEVNTINGGKTSFRWRLTFFGDKSKTPTLKYDKNTKYALNFEITRSTPATSNTNEANTLDKNLCLTSKPFDGDKILRDYLGDMNFALQDSKFSNYEFIRVWGNDNTQEDLLIDISGSDRTESINNNSYYDVYSLHYVDLKLKDFNSDSVDYSNYDPLMEIDEHNMRMKLDTEYSYNDNDIQLFNINDLKITNKEFELEDNDKYSVGVNVANIPESENNITLAKLRTNNFIDLTQYDAIKIGLSIDGEIGGSLSGLGMYISSTYEEITPSNIENEPNEDIIEVDTLPDLNASQDETIAKYGNKIIKRFEPVNGTGAYVYYQSSWDSETQKWIWGLLHNVKSYEIYEIVERSSSNKTLTITSDNKDKKSYYEITIDPNKLNLKHVKEIGFIALNDEKKFATTNINNIKFHEIITVQKDYYPIFSSAQNDKFTIQTHPSDTATSFKANGSISQVGTTTPATSQITMNFGKNIANEPQSDISSTGYTTIAVYDATSKSTANYNHIGIQMASDCLLVKDMLQLHLIQVDPKTKEEKVIDKVNLPTSNYIYYPTVSSSKINLVQVFKKLETNEKFDKIALVTTPKFIDYANKLKTVDGELVKGADNHYSISLFIGNIVLYQARTIPMFHKRMKMKFYFDQTKKDNRDYIYLRKIGVVAEYK